MTIQENAKKRADQHTQHGHLKYDHNGRRNRDQRLSANMDRVHKWGGN